jgi:GH25 family lysozyme M1 (1,4-beta-N-acetylmuramidase)
MTDQRWTNNAFGLDVSSIQQKVDYSALKKAGLDFMIARCGNGTWTWKNISDPSIAVDTKFADHCQGAWDNNIPFGAYFVFDPFVDPDAAHPLKDRQIAAIEYALKGKIGKSVQFLAIDIEIAKGANGTIATNHQISNRASQLITSLHILHPDLKIGVYTGKWFVDQYAPEMYAWMDYNVSSWGMFKWLAQYPTDADAPGSNVYAATIADFKGGKYAPEWPEVKSYPWLGNHACNIWQFSGDHYTLPGHFGSNNSPSSVDANFFNGTIKQMKEWCGYIERGDPVVVPDPEPEEETDPVTPPAQTVDLTEVKAQLAQIIANQRAHGDDLETIKAILGTHFK